jgi:hypothetical protein
MALLVHHSTPDANEMANGVATITSEPSGAGFAGRYVTQVGAVSVANPDMTAAPEVVVANQSSLYTQPFLDRSQPSSLLPLGSYVMNWRDDYEQLSALLATVRDGYRQLMTPVDQFILDFEYKKIQPGALQVKQVRRIPLLEMTNRISTFLLGRSGVFHSYQGLGRVVFQSHRLKSRWSFRTVNASLSPTNFAASPYLHVTIEHLNGPRIETLSGPIQSFAKYSNHVAYVADKFISTDSWQMNSLEGPATVQLSTWLPATASRLAPLVTLADAHISFGAAYDHQVAFIPGRAGSLGMTNRDSTLLVVAPPSPALDPDPFETTLAFGLGRTNFTFNITAVGNKLESRVEGFTTEPIVLTNYFSQTLDWGHLGGGPEWILEPRLEPGISPRTLAELDDLDIRMFYVLPKDRQRVRLFGRDGTSRWLPSQPGARMAVTVTESDSPPLQPVGSTYIMTFDDPNYTLIYSETNIVRGTFSYWRYPDHSPNLAGVLTDRGSWWLTFEGPGFGTVRRELRNQDGTTANEKGTFTAD